MSNGIRAVEATRQAFAAAWDQPLAVTTTEMNSYRQWHYKIHLDASKFHSDINEL